METKFFVAVLVSLVVISILASAMLISANDEAEENIEASEISPVVIENQGAPIDELCSKCLSRKGRKCEGYYTGVCYIAILPNGNYAFTSCDVTCW